MCAFVCVCLCAFVCVCVCVRVFACICVVYVCVCVYVCLCLSVASAEGLFFIKTNLHFKLFSPGLLTGAET